MLAAGGGLGVTPTFVAEPYVRRGELVAVLRDFMRPRTHITAIWPESRRNNPNVKAFMAFLSDAFPAARS